MNNRRRRADDFTDSLINFYQTNEEQSQTGHVASHQYVSSDEGRTCEKTNGLYNNNQTVSLKDILSVSDTTSYLSIDSGLNKCINLFHNKYLNKKLDFKEHTVSDSTSLETRGSYSINDNNVKKHKTVEIQCNLSRPRSMSSNTLKRITLSNIQVRRSKSCIIFNSDSKGDSKYNIKTDQLLLTETGNETSSHKRMETISSTLDTLSLSESLSVKDKYYSPKEEEKKYESISSEKSSTEELNPFELRTFLHSLEDPKPLKEADMLRRLSVNFCQDSPKNFTERLLTIIEESIANIDSETADVSFCKLTQELRKMCKLIEDETIEWPQSPSMLMSCKKKTSQEFLFDRSRKSLGTIATSNTGPITPISSPNINSPNKVYRRTPKKVVYNMKSPLHDSTTTFESLEAFCKGLYPDEHKTFRIEKKFQSDSPLKTLNNILHTCDNQMASLENSPNIYEKLKEAATASASNVIRLHNEHETNLQRDLLLSHKNRGKTNSKNTPDVLKQQAKVNSDNKRCEIKTDDLENTIMYEIAKKRQRCLNTAKIMMEIDADLKSTAAQKKCPQIVISQDSNSTDYDPKFMEILKSVKNYQDYLDQHKPLLNFLRQESLYSFPSCEKKDILKVNKKLITENFSTATNAVTSTLSSNKENIKTLRVSKSSVTKKKNTSPSSAKRNNIVVARPKLFVTPTKPIGIKNYKTRSNRIYFPNLGVICDENNKRRDLSPHKSLYHREIGNYDHVISPVGTYIRGTDPHLMKNLRPKTDEMLLTPRKRQTTQQFSSSKPKMKFRLSPKPKKKQIETSQKKVNIDLISHPKVHYKLPSHVHTIKETENRKIGNRVNELLRSTQDKIVIRHEGRTKSVQTDSLEQPEIHYDSAEESVHIEQTARKTFFSCTK
ncbi:uncharacterized protein LOC109862848 isoform X2 [Pseudomyrmex gracilis]|uniref:uncharacterized protein LOC109862848 isoform X2 n=1 Tax=Pseudomyrmex gracilis TaxID=219809 RepID=UPI000994A06A|nr:uncharacterized protein LOC109862848 isoform X2 [Pseudomyrmex gracilis]